jgi:hypothetical protein
MALPRPAEAPVIATTGDIDMVFIGEIQPYAYIGG